MNEPAHILIVDDDPYVCQMYSRLLSDSGYRVSTAQTGSEALSYLMLLAPDLVLVDRFLPDMEGQTVIERIKADASQAFTPVILITANDDLQARVLALDAGADDVLVKPIQFDELLARVRALLRFQRSQRSLRAEQRKTELLLHLTRELGGSFDLEVLLTRFLDHLADAVGAIRASIILTDPNDNSVSCYSSSRNAATTILNAILKEGVAGWALRERQPLVIPDTRVDPRWIGDSPYQRTVRSVAAMPVMREGRVLGVITLVHHRPGYFTPEHVELLHSAAAQSAVALESVQLYSLTHRQKEVIAQRAEDLARINEMSQHLAELMRPEQLMRLVVHMIHHAFNYPQVTIMLREENVLVVHASAGSLGSTDIRSDRIAYTEGVNGWVLVHNRLLRVDDLQSNADFAPTAVEPVDVRAKLVAPIMLRREVLGTIDIQSAMPGAFGPNDEAVLSTIANQFSVAFGNARLYRAVEDERSRLDAVLRGAADAIVLIGPHDELLLANPAAEERLGITISSGYGQPIQSQIHHPQLLRYLSNGVGSDFARNIGSVEVSLAADRTYSLSMSSVRGGDGHFLGRLAVLQDITASRLLERQEQERVRSVFRRYVSPVVAEQLLVADQEFGLPTERQVVVVCTDMRDFTALTERIGPHVLVDRILNRYFTAMTEVLYQYGGTIDKFMGDGLLAVFGSPIPHDDDPQRAILACVAMQQAFVELREDWKRDLGVEIGIGIGASYGPAIVGNIGSEQRLDYTLVGDVVNTASRLCAIAKTGQVIVSHHLIDALPANWDAIQHIRPLGKVLLKGKQDPHRIYDVCYTEDMSLRAVSGDSYP